MIRKGVITKVSYDKKSKSKKVTTVKPEDYVPEEPKQVHNKDCKFDPDNRRGHGRGGYLKYTYGK